MTAPSGSATADGLEPPPAVRVAVDATALLGRPTGIGTFTREVLRRLRRDPTLELVPFAVTVRGRGDLAAALADLDPAEPPDGRPPDGPAREHPCDRRPTGLFGRLGVPMPARPLRELWRRTDHPAIERWTGAVDVVWGPNFVVPPARAAAEVVTVHDLTPLRFPELCQRDTLAYPALVRRAVARGALVQTDSEAVAAEVRAWLGLGPDRVVAVPLGVDPPTAGDPAGGRRRAGADRYVLALGTVEPRKDLPTLVAAFDRAAAALDDLVLVVAGPDGWGVEAFDAAVASARHRDRIRRLGWVDAEARADLLAGARGLAFPSVYEGFGLPPLEAMAAGVPVVCSDLPVLAEVTGDAAMRRVPAGDVGAWTDALLALAALDGDRGGPGRAELVARGRRQAARFGWDACAARIGGLLRAAASGGRSGRGVTGATPVDIGRGGAP